MQGEEGEHERIVLKPRILKCKRLCHSGAMPACLSSRTTLFFLLFFPPSSLSFSPDTFVPFPPTFPLPPPSKFEIPACFLPYVNNYLLPTESNYAKRAFFFLSLISYSWTFETSRIVWSPCLEALTMGSVALCCEREMRCKALWYFEAGFFQKKTLF